MPRLGLLVLAFAHASCMEMRETVERMVMVRTTGSDLQPAATGYIYKKDGDGPEIKIKMGAEEVLEQLSKYYKQPEAFAAPIPAAAGPFHAKEDENKAASYTKEHVIPVVEKPEQAEKDHEGHIDGIANDEYDKIFKGYGFGKYNDDFADYLRDLGYFKDGLYHERDDGQDGHGRYNHGDKGYKGYASAHHYEREGDGNFQEEKGEGDEHGASKHHNHGDKGYKGYKSGHHYDKGGAGEYRTEKYESYSVSKKGGHKKAYDDSDDHGKHYIKGGGYKGGDHGHKSAQSKGEEVGGFHNVYDKDEFKKDHDFHDEEKHEGGFHKHGDGHAYHGSDAGGHKKGGAHESKHDEAGFGKGGFVKEESGDEHGADHAKEEGGESSHKHHGHYGAKGSKFGGKTYDYEVKH